MSSVTVATAAPAAVAPTTEKLPAIKLAGGGEPGDRDRGEVGEGGKSPVTTVVIIKAESSDDSVTCNQNGGPVNNSSSESSSLEDVVGRAENGAIVDIGVESGISKLTINGTNQNRMIRTASAKGKHLTRSHAMRESASPPRTREFVNGSDQHELQESPDISISQPLDTTALSPPKIYPDNGKTSTTTSQLDLDFPKLNAPKPKSPRGTTTTNSNNMDKSQSSSESSSNKSGGNSLDPHVNSSPTGTLNRKFDGRNLSPSSQHSNRGELSAGLDHDSSPLLSPGSHENRSSGRENSKSPSGENRNYHGKNKHKGAAAAKNVKTPRLKAQGSSSSVEGGNNNNSTVFISKDNLFEQFTDQSGVDLIKFFKETLNKNAKDRSMLLTIEKELHDLAMDRNRHEVKFPSMSSYNRMLIHRCAAYFGMDHNVDTSQTSVIVNVTKSTRIPEIHFDTLIRESLDEPRKSILKRDAHSFDECRQSLLPNPDRGMLDRKAKSFEEREEEYEKTRRRIFKGRDGLMGYGGGGGGGRSMDMQDEQSWPWSSTESSDHSGKIKAQNNRLLKVHSLSVDTRHDRPSVSKSHSFGGYGGPSSGGGGSHHHNHHGGHHLNRGDSITSTKSAGPRFFTKQESMGGTPWRLSPSSSGYKTQTQSLRSDSITPSPTGYGSGGDHTPEPQSTAQSPGVTGATGGGGGGSGSAAGSRSVVWAVTDMASVPRGSVLIDPQTLQPIVNQDGSIYYFDPSNVPPIAMKMTHHGQMNRHYPPPFMGGGGGNGARQDHPTHRRRTERSKGMGGEDSISSQSSGKEKNSSNTGSIDVIPEDQFQVTGEQEARAVPSEEVDVEGAGVDGEGESHYSQGGEELTSPQSVEDSRGIERAEALPDNGEVMIDHVERIYIPEHKHQATSPGHPMAQSQEVEEEYVPVGEAEEVVAAVNSDTELASSSQCLTPPPTPSQQPPPPPLEVEHDPIPVAVVEEDGMTATTTDTELGPEEVVISETPKGEEVVEQEELAVDLDADLLVTNVAITSAASAVTSSTDPSLNMTISTSTTTSTTTCTSSTPSTTTTTNHKTESTGGDGIVTTAVATTRPMHKTFNRYYNNNSQGVGGGDPRSSSTTVVSPLSASTQAYQVHTVGGQQYVAQGGGRAEEHHHMQAYQPTGIAYTTTTIDANGNAYATTPNVSYTYQQMPESGGYMVYAAPYPMEAVSEMPSYYVPVYDQAGNATLVPATTNGARVDPHTGHQATTTILQAGPPPGTHLYQTAAPNTTLIPALPAGSQLVYAPDGQFGTAASAGMQQQQQQQFATVPAGTYPPGTTVTYAPYGATAYNPAAQSTYHPNWSWGQPMTTTYYVSSPAAQATMPTAVPIQIPMQMAAAATQPQLKGGNITHSSPPTPQATTFAGNPFGNPGAMQISGGDQQGMQPVYAMQMGGGSGGGGGNGHSHGQNKYPVYPYSTPVALPMPPTATPPTATVYQPYNSHGKAASNTPPQGGQVNDSQTNPSSTTSTPLQKSPPVQMPETTMYEKKNGNVGGNRRTNEAVTSGGHANGAPPRTGYLGNNYNAAYARNPNQTYQPRSYAPKKQHYGGSGGDGAQMGGTGGSSNNKPIVMSTPMNQSASSSASPGIYNPHYGQPHQQGAQGPPHGTHPTGIRGPRPKPANLDLRRTGSHYQGNNTGAAGGGGGGATVTGGNAGGNSQRNTPSTNSAESNNSPNSIVSGGGGAAAATGGTGADHHSNRNSSSNNNNNAGQMGYYSNAPQQHHNGAHPPPPPPLVMHQPLMGSPAGPPPPGGAHHPGMYVKLGQTYFPHPTIATQMGGGSRRSPPNEIRPHFNHHHHPHSLTTGLYPMNHMQISGPRHGGGNGPRHSHHNSYKGSR